MSLSKLMAMHQENIVNIKDLQKSPSKHLKNITRIMRGKKTLGYFLDEEAFQNLLDDFHAAANPEYIKSIEKSRKSGRISLDDVAKKHGA